MTQGKGGGPKKGFKQSKAHKEKIKKSQLGENNSNYKDGGRIDYRKKVKAKDDEIVHHKDGDRMNNSLSNLERLKGRKPGAKTNSKHEQITNRNAGRKKKK